MKFEKRRKGIQCKKNLKGKWWVTIGHRKRNLTHFTEINSKCFIDLILKCKTIKVQVYNIGENINKLEFGDDFLYIPKVLYMKEKLIS